jgi:WD40 repeat protein/serine/threonine protein kinase/tetratricopeptide (TPR) repeat protein
MSISSGERNPVELLAEEFLERKRRGERPTLQEYLDRHPGLAEEIRDLFPALLMMENLGESSGAATGSPAADGVAVEVRLQRLGDYRILREIGRGGMGVVYEAEQESLGRRVALKVLSASSLLDPKQVRRFEREAKSAARLHHTNIVPVFGVGRQDFHHYFVMQFIAGLGLDAVLEDLRRLRFGKSQAVSVAAAGGAGGISAAEVARSLITGRFVDEVSAGNGSATEPFDDPSRAAPSGLVNGPAADPSSVVLPGSSEPSGSSDPDRQYYRSVARIGIQVAEALEYANRQGILHRDIKPSNLLLDNRGNVWVADFGLAKTAEADDLTHTGDILGTIRYMAPERFSGSCDALSDVYSLGLTLYELIALRPAYEASDRHRLMERVLNEEPERLKKAAPGVPRDLETIVAKATARDPAGRYVTAGALAEDLRRYVEDRPIRARRISPFERAWRWCRRNQVVASSIGLAALTLVGVAVLAVLYAREQRGLAAARKLYAAEQAHRADDQAAAAESYKAALSESNRRLAMLNFERGRVASEKGQVGPGMLWTVESLRMATEAGDEAGKHLALASLAAWRRYLVEPRRVFSHSSDVVSVAFSPDGKTILTGCMDKTARLWDAVTGRPIGQPLVHQGAVTAVAFSPDGKTILTGGGDKTARLWDVAAGRPIGQPMVHLQAVKSAAFSPDGKTILTGGMDKTARLWDAGTGQPLGQPILHPGFVWKVAFSPDGKTILTGCMDKTARLWDAATGRPIGKPLVHSGGVFAVEFSPDGKTILTAGMDRMARLWDAASGRPVGPPMEHASRVFSAEFSPDGQWVLTGSEDNTAQVWDAVTGQRCGGSLEHQGIVYSVAFSPDGRSILTGSQDGAARLWDCEAGQFVGRPLDHGMPAAVVEYGPDGKTLIVSSVDGRIRLWDIESGHPRGQLVEQGSLIDALALSPDGQTILTGSYEKTDKAARLWDAATGRPLGPSMAHPVGVNAVAFSPDGKTILTGTGTPDRTVRLWDADTGRPIGRPLVHPGSVVSMAASPDGKTILTGCLDWMARLWDADTGRPGQLLAHSGSVLRVAFSPDGKTILTGSADKTVRQWDALTGRPIGTPLMHPHLLSSIAFSPDGKTILTGCSDKMARLWDAATCRPIGPPLPHPSAGLGEMRVAFSADGRFLLASDHRTARRWDAPAPLPEDLPRLAAWVEAATGLELDQLGAIHVLDADAWRDRRRRLDQLGGPPSADPAPRLDPIVCGDEPAARGDAWKERGQWDRAEAAYAEADRARPLNPRVRDALVRLHAERGRLDRVAATLADAVRKMPDDVVLRRQWCLALLGSGDRAGWRGATAALLDRFGGTIDPRAAGEVARSCALGPGAAADPAVPVRLAESAFGLDTDGTEKADALSTLGAALYRAGRSDDAIRRLEEAIRVRGGEGTPRDWAFLAMAHQRLGHRAEARLWLDRLREHRLSDDPARFWDELEVRLLRSEAEAVVLYDPVFPADPFAR